jgi:hypothetical protein
MKCVHFVGFRGDDYWNAVKVFGKPHFVHKDFDDRVFSEVGDDDVVVFGTKYHPCKVVWDASAVDKKWTN